MNRAILGKRGDLWGTRALLCAFSLTAAVSAFGADAVPPAPVSTAAVSTSQTALTATEPATPAASGNKLQSIDVQPLAGKRVQLTMHMSAPPQQPTSFALEKPARISFDLPNTSLSLAVAADRCLEWRCRQRHRRGVERAVTRGARSDRADAVSDTH